MTVAELIEKLQQLPPDLLVVIADRPVATDVDSPTVDKVEALTGGREGEYWIGGRAATISAVIL